MDSTVNQWDWCLDPVLNHVRKKKWVVGTPTQKQWKVTVDRDPGNNPGGNWHPEWGEKIQFLTISNFFPQYLDRMEWTDGGPSTTKRNLILTHGGQAEITTKLT